MLNGVHVRDDAVVETAVVGVAAGMPATAAPTRARR